MRVRPDFEAALFSGVGFCIKAGGLSVYIWVQTVLERLYCLNGSSSHRRHSWSGHAL